MIRKFTLTQSDRTALYTELTKKLNRMSFVQSPDYKISNPLTSVVSGFLCTYTGFLAGKQAYEHCDTMSFSKQDKVMKKKPGESCLKVRYVGFC